MLPADRDNLARTLFGAYKHWIMSAARPCLPEAPSMDVSLVKATETGIMCYLLYVPPSVPYDRYASVVKAFHPGCKVQTVRDEDENTEVTRIIVPFDALPTTPNAR